MGRDACAYATATQGLFQGIDSLTLSQLLGHSDMSALAKNYAHLSRNPRHLHTQAPPPAPSRNYLCWEREGRTGR